MNFNWKQYLSNYPDLTLARINTQRDAWRHYQNHGKLENRTDKCLKTFLPNSFEEFLKGPAVVVSLKRSHETRGKYTLNLLQEAGFENCKIFDGFDGYKENIDEVIAQRNLKYSPIHQFAKGQKGCGISHMNLWKKILDENLDYLIIFEDDALPEPKFKEIAKTWYNHTPKDIDLCYMGSIAWEHEHPQIWGKHISFNSTFCTHAYIVTNNFAKKAFGLIRQSCEKEGLDNIDSEMKKWCDRGQISWCTWNNKGVFNSILPIEMIHGYRNNGLIYQNANFDSIISAGYKEEYGSDLYPSE
jgi:GR25 family glycosyltransferase involved in LPS biosynthesis